MNRSIIAGTGPDVEALINEWTEDGYAVESSYDNGRWWHRRLAPEQVRDVNIPANRIELSTAVASTDPSAPDTINDWAEAGHVVVSARIGGAWWNRAGKVGVR